MLTIRYIMLISAIGISAIGLAVLLEGAWVSCPGMWEDVLGQAHSASVNERPMLNKIRQRVTHLRVQLTPQDRAASMAPVSSRSPQSSVLKDAN